MLVGVGLIGTEIVRQERRKRRTPQRISADFVEGADAVHLKHVDRVLADSSWDSPPLTEEPFTAPASPIAGSSPSPAPVAEPTLTSASRTPPLLWLAACLLVAGILGVSGLFSRSEKLPPEVAASTAPRWETKNIEDLQVGDLVLAWDEKTGRQELKPVDRTYRRVADHLQHVTIRASDGTVQTLHTTGEHPFWVPTRGWVKAGELARGESLLQPDGGTSHVVANLHEDHPQGVPVFNLRVLQSHTYFASAAHDSSGILVHNANYDDYMNWLESAHPNIHSLAVQAEIDFPNVPHSIQNHHVDPKYLGGLPEGYTIPLPAPYHQAITSRFRSEAPYGQRIRDPDGTIASHVYEVLPLPHPDPYPILKSTPLDIPPHP